MKNKIVISALLIGMLCSITTAYSQENYWLWFQNSYENKVAEIVKKEKANLKIELAELKKKFDEGNISEEEYEYLKLKVAKEHKIKIDEQIAYLKKEISDKVDQRVTYEIQNNDYKERKEKDSTYIYSKFNRTSFEIHGASGFNFLSGGSNALGSDDLRPLKSSFYELGLGGRTRIFKPRYSKFYVTYKLAAAIANYSFDEAKAFTVTNNEILLSDQNLKKSKLVNYQLQIPIMLEFDMSKPIKTGGTGRIVPRLEKKFRIGFGGYLGYKLGEKQVIVRRNPTTRVSTRANDYFNDFSYGLNFLVGYGTFSLYAKKELNSLFDNLNSDVKSMSLGVRLDIW